MPQDQTQKNQETSSSLESPLPEIDNRVRNILWYIGPTHKTVDAGVKLNEALRFFTKKFEGETAWIIYGSSETLARWDPTEFPTLQFIPFRLQENHIVVSSEEAVWKKP